MIKVIRKFIAYLLCIVAFMLAAVFVWDRIDLLEVKAQEPVIGDITLTDSEKYSIRTAEFNKLAALIALQEANGAMEVAVNKIYENHKGSQKTHSLCAGPGIGTCEGVPKDAIVLRKNPVDKEK